MLWCADHVQIMAPLPPTRSPSGPGSPPSRRPHWPPGPPGRPPPPACRPPPPAAAGPGPGPFSPPPHRQVCWIGLRRHAPHHQVPVGDHPQELPGGAAHRQEADVVPGQQPGRQGGGLLGLDGDGPGVHHFLYLHKNTSLCPQYGRKARRLYMLPQEGRQTVSAYPHTSLNDKA